MKRGFKNNNYIFNANQTLYTSIPRIDWCRGFGIYIHSRYQCVSLQTKTKTSGLQGRRDSSDTEFTLKCSQIATLFKTHTHAHMYTDTQTHIKNPNLSKTLLETQSIRNHKSHIAPLNNPFYQRQKGEKEEDRKEDRSFVTEDSPGTPRPPAGRPWYT